MVNSAAQLTYSARRSEHVSLLQELYWLHVPEWIDYRLSILVYRCINGTAPPVSYNGLPTLSRMDACDLYRQCCCTFHGLYIRPSATVPSPVAAAGVWNMLPPAIMSLPSLQIFKCALQTELFLRSYENAH